jgi:hypothetical protein
MALKEEKSDIPIDEVNIENLRCLNSICGPKPIYGLKTSAHFLTSDFGAYHTASSHNTNGVFIKNTMLDKASGAFQIGQNFTQCIEPNHSNDIVYKSNLVTKEILATKCSFNDLPCIENERVTLGNSFNQIGSSTIFNEGITSDANQGFLGTENELRAMCASPKKEFCGARLAADVSFLRGTKKHISNLEGRVNDGIIFKEGSITAHTGYYPFGTNMPICSVGTDSINRLSHNPDLVTKSPTNELSSITSLRDDQAFAINKGSLNEENGLLTRGTLLRDEIYSTKFAGDVTFLDRSGASLKSEIYFSDSGIEIHEEEDLIVNTVNEAMEEFGKSFKVKDSQICVESFVKTYKSNRRYSSNYTINMTVVNLINIEGDAKHNQVYISDNTNGQ